MTGPLTGARVVELAGLGPGPFAAMLLADLGADVVRVDRLGPAPADERSYVMHRGRRSVAVDVKHSEGREIVLALVDGADALIEGNRPGVMERLGLGPDDCLARNPRLAYGRMTGWGQSGPLARTAGHDIDYIALSGALSVAARQGERPVPPVNLLGDFGGGGAFLALGLIAAMWEASRSGVGQVVDAAMVDGSAVLTTMLHGLLAQGRWRDEAGVNFADSGSPFYDTYECADGKHVAVGPLERPFYAQLARRAWVSTRPICPDRRDEAAWPALKERFAAVFRTRTPRRVGQGLRTDRCLRRAGPDAHRGPAPPAQRRAPHVRRACGHRAAGARSPLQPHDRALERSAPPPGEHTDEVLSEVGYQRSDIERLARRGRRCLRRAR